MKNYKKMFPFGITYTEEICFKKVNGVHFDFMLTSVRETLQKKCSATEIRLKNRYSSISVDTQQTRSMVY